VRIHVGTAELLATANLLGRDRLERGESGPAQLFLSQPAVTTWSQPFVVRSESPVVTIGGGTVLDPCAQRIRKADERTLQLLADLGSHDELTRASAALYFAGLRDWTPENLARSAGIEQAAAAYQRLLARGDVQEIRVSPTRTIRVHRLVLAQLCERIETTLRNLHKKNPLRLTLDRAPLVASLAHWGDASLIETVLDSLRASGRIRLTERSIALVGQGPRLSANEEKLLVQIIELYRQAGLKPPTVKECQQSVAKNRDAVPQLITLATQSGELVQIAPDFYLHRDVESQIRATLSEKLAGSPGHTLSEIRDILNTTRKFAVPLCEYYDEIGFTKREGDLRVLAASAQLHAST
jgi:selenocysteine-specific elongation factor